MICELCSSNSFTKADEFYQCDFCRTKYTGAQAKNLLVEGTVKVDRTDEVEKLLSIASNAFEIGHHDEANEYATRTLEIDPENPRAWFLKGASAGHGATVENGLVKIREMVRSFERGAEHLPSNELDHYKHECAPSISSAVRSKYNESSRYVEAYLVSKSNDWDSRETEWQKHLVQSQEMMRAVEMAYRFDGDSEHLKLAIQIASENIRGALATDGGVFQHTKSVSPEENERLLTEIGRWKHLVQQDDPTYDVETPTKFKAKACFVVTAALGNEDAPAVVVLRRFRDTILVRSAAGRQFTNWYYRHGPQAAQTIEDSLVLRGIIAAILVAPATLIAWTALKLFPESHRRPTENSAR